MLDQQPLMFVLRKDDQIRERTDAGPYAAEMNMRDLPALDPQIQVGEWEPALDDGIGESNLPIELECSCVDDERARRGAGLGDFIDDADANAAVCEPQRKGKAGRAGTRDQDIDIGHEARRSDVAEKGARRAKYILHIVDRALPLSGMARPASLEIHPLDRKRWRDLEQLFNGPGGAQVRGCWCMYYRRSGRAEKPADMTYAQFNKCALKALVDSGIAPGLIGYRDGEPIAWVSLGPREDYAKLARSSVMKPVDDQPVWSVVCFYTAKEARGQHLAELMLKSAIDYARSHGARLIEAYPSDKHERERDDSMWFGAKSMYDRAGFVEVARRKPARPVVRKTLRPQRESRNRSN
jgi:GNAT superfamily N-acetyltransferase